MFQLVDGEDLYEITIEETINYSSNELHVLNTVTPRLAKYESNTRPVIIPGFIMEILEAT